MGVMDDEVRRGKQRNDQPRSDRIDSGTTAPPKREQIALWTVESLQNFSQQTVQNAWFHRRFGWFPEEL